MAVRNVLRMGHPLLQRRAEPVTEFDTPSLEAVIEDLFDTMAAREGAGIAAPQIGVSKQIVIFGGKAHPRYPGAGAVPLTVLINPTVIALTDDRQADWEGCLSVPGLRGWVPRWTHVRYQGMDPQGRPIEREAEGFHARVVQHEVDHLQGILFPQRIEDLSRFGFEDELFRR